MIELWAILRPTLNFFSRIYLFVWKGKEEKLNRLLSLTTGPHVAHICLLIPAVHHLWIWVMWPYCCVSNMLTEKPPCWWQDVFLHPRSRGTVRHSCWHWSAAHTTSGRCPLPVLSWRHWPRHARQAAGAAPRRPGSRHPQRHGSQRQWFPRDGPRETHHDVFVFGGLGCEDFTAGGLSAL